MRRQKHTFWSTDFGIRLMDIDRVLKPRKRRHYYWKEKTRWRIHRPLVQPLTKQDLPVVMSVNAYRAEYTFKIKPLKTFSAAYHMVAIWDAIDKRNNAYRSPHAK